LDTSRGRFNPLGGYDIAVLAGEALVRGEVVDINAALDGSVVKSPVNSDMPVGAVFDDQPNVGGIVWITVAGIGYLKPEAAVTATRGYVCTVSAATAGRVEGNAALPSVAKHNRECGHWLDSGSGNGVATRAIIHWN
jgi:hypothetical protein